MHTNGSMLTSRSGQGVGSGLGEDLISKDKEAGAGEVGHTGWRTWVLLEDPRPTPDSSHSL